MRTFKYALITLLLISFIAVRAQSPGDVDITFNQDNLEDHNNSGANIGQSAFMRPGPNGTIWVAGMSSLNSDYTGSPCRLRADGSRDTTFLCTLGSNPKDMIVQGDGTVLIASYNVIRRANINGSWDNSYQATVNYSIERLLHQPDGKTLVFGEFETVNGTPITYHGAARLDPDGSLDPTFSASGVWLSTSYSDAFLRPDGKIIAVGDFTVTMNGPDPTNIAVLGPDGGIDLSLTPGFPGLVGPGGRIKPWPTNNSLLLYNSGTQFGGQSVSGIFLLDSLMSLSPIVSSSLGDSVYAHVKYPAEDCVIYPDGRMLFVGQPPIGAPIGHIPMVRVFPNGSLDPTFDPYDLFNGPDPAIIKSVHVDQDGNIYCLGTFNHVEHGAYRNGYMRLDSTGSLDVSFMAGNGFNGSVNAVDQLPDGRYIVGGGFTTYRGQRARGLVCLDNDGEIDPTFSIGTGLGLSGIYPRQVNALAVEPNGRILVVGNFDSYNNVPRNDFLRLMSNGALDGLFDPLGPGSSYDAFNGDRRIFDIQLQPDGKMVIAGFISWGNYQAQGIARYNSDGTRDVPFDHGTGFSSGPASIALQADGKVICGGGFTHYAGASCEVNCCRLNADGSLDAAFAIPGPLIINFDVQQVLMQPNGKVLLSGPFNSIGGHQSNNIGRMNSNGSPDISFSAPHGAGTPFVLQSNGSIISGSKEYDGVVQQGVVRMLGNSNWDPSFGQPDSTWTFSSDAVTTLFIDDQERVLVGGVFRRMRGHSGNGLVRLFTDFTTSVSQDEDRSDQLKVWPNPTSGIVSIALPWFGTTDDAYLELVNTLGQRVMSQRIGQRNGVVQLDLSDVRSGAYVLRLIDSWGVTRTQFILDK